MEKFFLKYDDPCGDENYWRAKQLIPDLQKVITNKSIQESHAHCASISLTDQFMVIDADAFLLDDFKMTEVYDLTKDQNFVYIFSARNPVNDLEYGHGGIKVFQYNLFGENKSIDFSTSFVGHVRSIKKTLNIHKFNTSPFHAWRTAFRECVKLSSGLIPNRNQHTDEERLETWCTKFNDVEYVDHVKDGALAGREFGRKKKDLTVINNFQWLHDAYENKL